MTTTVKTVEILTTLEEDPHVNFFPWEMDIHDTAAGMAKSIHQNGLLSAILVDAQWAAYPGNTSINPNGQVQIADKFAPPVYIVIHDGMTNVELYVANASNTRLQLWIDSLEVLKRAVIKSLGRVVRQIVREPKIRFQQLSVADIIARVRARYGRMQKDTKQNLKERMLTMLQTTDGLDTHISNLTDMFDVSETAGFPILETDKVDMFRETVSGHPMIVKVFETFDFEFPDTKLTTYGQLAAYLTVHLPNLRHAQLAATRATANLVAATAYTALEAKAQRLKAEVDKLKRKHTPDKNKNKNKNKKLNEQKQKGQRTYATDDTPVSELKYCHGHGYQKSHTSADCKLLASDKSKFTHAMRKATNPHKPPGGSQKVNGQVVSSKPKTVTANMMNQVQFTHDADIDETNSNSRDADIDETNSNSGDNDFDETEAFLAGILRDAATAPSEYDTETATAMMMEDGFLLDDTTSSSGRNVLSSPEVPRLSLDENQGDQIHGGRGDGPARLEEGSNLGGFPTHEVPRSLLDVNQGDQIHVDGEHDLARPSTSPLSRQDLPSNPTQAKEAAPPGGARSSTSRQSPPQDKTTINLSARTGLGRGGSKVEVEVEEIPTTYTLITDGSQFRLPFWEAELHALQNQLRRQIARRPSIRPRTIPTADELQIQYVTWLLERPTLPLLLEPASSGFYETIYECHITPKPDTALSEPKRGTGFFDEEYVGGLRCHSPHDTSSTILNPAQRAVPSYQDVFTAQLTTLADVHRHEERIYQPGYTPTAIRDNITAMLRDSKPDQHMVDFQAKDIPPSNRDPQTNRVLAGLLRKRDSLDRDFQLPTHSVAADGTALTLNRQFEEEHLRRDKEYNRLNRGMYHVYAASAHIIHDHNFLSYCRPELRNLPESTAYTLETLKAKLKTQDSETPPYHTIQRPNPTHTQPTFSSSKPSYADVLRPPLQPRKDWMRAQPPYLPDTEADETWHRGNERMLGDGWLTDEMIQQQIDILKETLAQRNNPTTTPHSDCVPSAGATAPWRQPIANQLAQRVFRQGVNSNISDKNRETAPDQSRSSKTDFFQSSAVPPSEQQPFSEKEPRQDQSESSGQSLPSVQTANDIAAGKTGRKRFVVRERDPCDYESARMVLAPYDRATLQGQESRTKARDSLAKRDQNKQKEQETRASPSTKPDKKRKSNNDFGGGTFWNRPAASKRHPPSQSDALAAISDPPLPPHDLIVDTGASHVLFQQKHMGLLTHVQLSDPTKNPYAILRAANGQVLTAIGKGIFKVKTISVVAYIFRDEDLVHNLLGIAPFADCGCKAVFTAHDFNLYHRKTLILTGKRHSANLWHISLDQARMVATPTERQVYAATTTVTEPVLLLHEETRRDSTYVQFVHACLGSPPPTTFLRAVEKGYLSGENQFPRLTSRLVRKHMPSSEATAKGHLTKTPTAQPHGLSDSVSARRRAHAKAQRNARTIMSEDHTKKGPQTDPAKAFDPTTVPKSTSLHLDYTGRLPTRGSKGTLYFLVACWGSYIHLEPLSSMTGAATAVAIKAAVTFFRDKQVTLTTIRMDNQSSPEVRQLAHELDLQWDIVTPYQKQPNRAERAIRTAKNHIIATRAGFHPDCSPTFIDRCLFQIELTLNVMHPFEYDPKLSAHHGLFQHRFDFARHPIAPAGSKVLTWDSPDTRGSWADHGVSGIYLGPAMRHFRAFHIWVPQTYAQRISSTVWWFVKPFLPDDNLLCPANNHILYPASKERLCPIDNGEDLLGRCFFEPTVGVCCITHLGPVLNPHDEGSVHSLHYRCLSNQAEFFSSVDQITTWIHEGPLLLQPANEPSRTPAVPVTFPSWSPMIHMDSEPDAPLPLMPNSHTSTPIASSENLPSPGGTPSNVIGHDPQQPIPTTLRRSQRKRKAPDFLTPKFKGKAYCAQDAVHYTKKERVPVTWVYLGKERVSQPEIKVRRLLSMKDKSSDAVVYSVMFRKYRQSQRDLRNQRVGWSDLFNPGSSTHLAAMNVNKRNNVFQHDMPKPKLPPVYPNGPLNLNPDGTTITYRKSHQGPNAAQWAQADAEELERLFKSGTLRPILHQDIPNDKRATYVNPVCSEKLRDDGSLKLRTRATIGGDKIDYPYSTTALTAELESIKILINAMISDNAAFSTVDLEDFYLGTPLPHPEYIRIPVSFIPKKVMTFYNLKAFVHKGALFCIVLKTHYGLPQAGALSQERLFKHLEGNGYHQLHHAPALFRNGDGSIRFALVVDDFAVVWSSSTAMNHFLGTLRKLYTVKVDYQGQKYLGLTIHIDRPHRHVTLSMPGYIARLLKRVRPQGIKGASTPSIYSPPNYKSPRAQTATVDASPLASASQQHELQVVVGTLLYYARTVDPSILTAVHELGSVQSKPTINDLRKMERLLQYVSTHQRHGIRFHASSMQLQVQSDASYLSRTKARSVLGGFHYLGSEEAINGPIFCTSKMISCIVTSAAEAELGAAFQNGQKGAQFRNTLIELGYPQQPTPILVDNTVAEGLANDTINAKRSKSMDVRFFWLRDRVKRMQFRMKHLQGRWNISDFFTKALPKEKFEQFTPYIIVQVDEDIATPKRHTVTLDKQL